MPLSKSLATCGRLAEIQRALKLGGRAAVGLAKSGAEMAVAGEAQIHAQCGEILRLAEQLERPRQPQAQLIAIQGRAFELLKHLSQINRRYADLRADVCERPASREIRGQ